MSVTKHPITVEGARRLKEQLEQLVKVERPHVIAAIAEARAHGDLKENAEYHAAKEQQGMIEAKIRDIEHKLSHAQIIDITELTPSGRIVFGCTVELLDCEKDTRVKYQIVGVDEADLKDQKISVTSPIARALIGKEQGDYVEVTTPSGIVEYEVVVVEYV